MLVLVAMIVATALGGALATGGPVRAARAHLQAGAVDSVARDASPRAATRWGRKRAEG